MSNLSSGINAFTVSQHIANQKMMLPDTCIIQTVARASVGGGKQSETWTDTYTGVHCRVVHSSGDEFPQADQIAPARRFIITLPYDQAVSTNDRIVHGGNTYEIRDIADGSSYLTAKRLLAERRE